MLELGLNPHHQAVFACFASLSKAQASNAQQPPHKRRTSFFGPKQGNRGTRTRVRLDLCYIGTADICLRNMHVHWWDAKPTVSQTFIQLHLTSSTGDRSLPVTKVVGRPLVQGRPERSELWEAALRPEDSLLLSRNLEEGAAPQCSVDKSSEKRGTGNAPQCPSGAQEREYQHSLLLSPELGLSPLLSHPGQPL